MNKKLVLSMALGLAGASSLLAASTTVDVYITGSTAFRANVFTACTNLFNGAPNVGIFFADSTHGGSSSGASAGSWVMSGNNLISTLTNIQGDSLVIHGLFTGSIQGLQTVESQTPLIFAQPTGTPGGTASTYVTNSATIAFSDSAGAASPFNEVSPVVEEQVAVQPFVVCKSTPTTGPVTNISNVSWEQLEYGIPTGRIPLSAWTANINDTNTFVYIMQRTKDSGTRRTETAGEYYQYNDPVTVYIYDFTNNFFYTPTVTAATTMGASPNGVVGPAGNNNNNLNWGFGYVGGGDIKSSLLNNNSANQAVAVLSMSDSKGVTNAAGGNWGTVVTFNGFWPTAGATGGINIRGNTGTNDYSPVTLGYYPLWGYEVIAYSTRTDLISDQDITPTELGTQTIPGSFLGVFNAQTLINGGAPIVGSIEREIEITKPNGATAIRLSDMVNSRSSVGGLISPPFN